MSKSSLQQIIEARVDGDLQRLSAASLRHVYEIYAQRNRRSLALLGAWQQRESHEVNLCNIESFPAFDPMLIAAYFYRRGLAFEYLPRGFFEGMAAGLCERAYRRRR